MSESITLPQRGDLEGVGKREMGKERIKLKKREVVEEKRCIMGKGGNVEENGMYPVAGKEQYEHGRVKHICYVQYTVEKKIGKTIDRYIGKNRKIVKCTVKE